MGASERRFQMMQYLCRVRVATMPALAERFGVSTRTIMRDIDELGDLIPLEIKTGRHIGGVYVMSDYVWDKAYMSTGDIALLQHVKCVANSGEALCLDEEAMARLERIIQTYSKPGQNDFQP